ncbi:hypothetical protein [uncultured Chloroflexus sp.]|uniref:hypothetical protein n=1 Tax=uncultured Chloroflexus sp. TaxID=214040 RepID=UPI00262F6CC4|nr:hypothetical protein [uncultured Chloroflexus sp.]
MTTENIDEMIAQRRALLRTALQRIVLLRETGPKSAAWHRARIKTMWRLQQQLADDAAASRHSEQTHDRS